MSRYTGGMNAAALLAAWADQPDVQLLSPAALRLARAVPETRPVLDGLLHDPVDRALAGLGPAPDWRTEQDPNRAALVALVEAEAGARLDHDALARLEARSVGVPGAWVLAAQARALADPAREREARRTLAHQELPYAMPGQLHPLMVEVLAAGDRVLPALHVDWVRKLTAFAAEALILDARALGLWFWPVLRALSPERLRPALARLPDGRRLPPGGKGLAAAYLFRVGGDWERALVNGGPADRLLAALAVLGDRSSSA